MTIDPMLTLACFGIGIIVGLTGMGGGALMTPVLVIFFGIPPLTAVSSDLVAAAVMKPVGSYVHAKHGTVNWQLVKYLCIGSIPAAFSGVFIIKALGNSAQVEATTKTALGIAVLIAAFGLVARAYIRLVERARVRDGKLPPLPTGRPEVTVRKVPTILLGVFGGVIVGMTSVGSGSLIIIALMALYPTLKANQLVGTDLVQAVPLVASAALAHILFGDFKMALTASLLIGSIPGVWIGARVSSRAPGGLIRRALAFVLLASALKMLNVSNTQTLQVLGIALVAAPMVWMLVRRRHGFPALAVRRSPEPGEAAPSVADQPLAVADQPLAVADQPLAVADQPPAVGATTD